ncbi:hydantoinase/oxoprolinase family protein [Novosphingobium profundi]|uniref:hydantoinase/oxoprolinase family protein n=1 Tax=Novosphingobium profundi TaxID=1774954 RepID=UPI001BDA0CFB|nr:hydantoinase/oxoprolinase family protein [Novosphingobium profundi]MBT0670760.1 hydantoinase/oxoprolinase family protein [Novosphingobium profundi]
MEASRAYVGIDVGGTFTDLAMYDSGSGLFSTVKVPSSPPTFWPSVIQALDAAQIDATRAATVLHGTTVHLNAFLERRGARMALVTTEGFRDVYEMRRGNRPQPYDMHFRYPEPLVKRRDIFTLAERTLADGTVQRAPDPAAMAALAKDLRAGGYEAVAICFLHSYRNPANEKAVAEALRAAMPEAMVGPSHEVCREWREYERTSTAVINGYASPVLKRYLSDLLTALREKANTRLFLLQSNGGLMRAEDAGDRGILSLLSGPVGGNVAGRALSREAGFPNLICIDMGGTSFEASLVIDGESVVQNEREVGGFPVLSPMVDIHTIGAGGGSIAWNDAGALRVGPQSAGARPGPACYGHGGTQPTVTDANIALGRLEDGCAFGDLKLDAGKARAAIAAFAEGFAMPGNQMAQGILDVINEQMANAIRTITVRRGIDPREFALVAYGGAGPMHAADIARLLGVGQVVVPRAAGAFSAWGMLQSDLVHDHAETVLMDARDVDWIALDHWFAEAARELGARLQSEGVPEERVAFERMVDVRYAGQENTLSVTLEPALFAQGEACGAALRARFDADYVKVFGHSNPDEAIEIATLRLRATGRSALDARTLLEADDAVPESAAPERTGTIVFDGAPRETRFVSRGAMAVDQVFAGPCVIEESTTTTIVPPDFSARIDGLGNLILTRAETAQ